MAGSLKVKGNPGLSSGLLGSVTVIIARVILYKTINVNAKEM